MKDQIWLIELSTGSVISVNHASYLNLVNAMTGAGDSLEAFFGFIDLDNKHRLIHLKFIAQIIEL